MTRKPAKKANEKPEIARVGFLKTVRYDGKSLDQVNKKNAAHGYLAVTMTRDGFVRIDDVRFDGHVLVPMSNVESITLRNV